MSVIMRRFSSSMKPINLKLMASSFLLQVHPDVLQLDKRSVKEVHESIKDGNEQALKELNSFIDLAGAGCNGTIKNDMLGTRAFDLAFHIPLSKKDKRQRRTMKTIELDGQEYMRIEEKIEIPHELYDVTLRTLSSIHTNHHLTATLWRKYTNSVFSSLFHQAGIPVVSKYENGQLIPWDKEVVEGQSNGGSSLTQPEDIEVRFKKLLTRERNIVFKFTTGFEKDVQKHRVLLDLLRRVHVEDVAKENQTRAFNWLGEVLLRNFMELRLHNLIWNRVVLILTENPDTHLHVIEEDDGLAVVIGFTDDIDSIIHFLHEQVTRLEDKLKSKGLVVPESTPKKNKRRQKRS
ncbi:hypothetical protein THRCLA_09484 [Thraustotheca clavata]|uniref:DUF4460 domain-containing protein n=1 Tax=Thraustotheca clavata TaxID=74557 RepID=A0A1V9YVW0_9STRA|nr:hypothetical protein THRCLA_09484 [Thraustotheca clavata]